MQIESAEFKMKERIPSRFTCDGENINPELTFKDVPKEARSLVLIMDDPDAPNGTFVHWVMWNIPPQITELKEGSEPVEAVIGLNSAGENEYTGPCPPYGMHRYFFKLYALNSELDLSRETTARGLSMAMQRHIIDQAELMGWYERK